MPGSRDEILERELEKLGEAGGEIGGTIGGAVGGAAGGGVPGAAGGAIGGGLGGRSGGRVGTRFASRFLKENRHEADVELDVPADVALRRVVDVLGEAGELRSAESEAPGARAVIAAGWLGMNPTVVDAIVRPVGEGRTRVTVRGVAKEGLVKQHAGQKAVEQVTRALARDEAP